MHRKKKLDQFYNSKFTIRMDKQEVIGVFQVHSAKDLNKGDICFYLSYEKIVKKKYLKILKIIL